MYYCRIKHSGLLKNRFTYFQIGLIISLTMVFFAFNIETEPRQYEKVEDWELPYEILQDPPITRDLPKEPPKPKPQSVKKIILPVKEIVEAPKEKVDPKPEPLPEKYVSSLPIVKKKEAPKVVKEKPKPKIVELPPEPVAEIPDSIYTFATVMPMYPGCKEDDYQLRKQCAEKRMLEFIYANIDYPPIARETGIEGLTVVQFVVDEEGSIAKINPLKKLGGGCTKEAIRVINKMPKWNPGIQNGRPVKVMFRLPITFKLN